MTANNGLSFANLYYQPVNAGLSIPEKVALDNAYRVAFGAEPPQLPAGATIYAPSDSDQPRDAVYKFFFNVNRWRAQANAAMQSLAASITSITPQTAPFEIADLISTNQAAFVSGQTDNIVSAASEESLGDIAKESSIDVGSEMAGHVVLHSLEEESFGGGLLPPLVLR